MSLRIAVLLLSVIVARSEAQCVLPGARPNVSTGCYVFRETTANSWEDAEADCSDLGGHLASVTSSEQSSVIQGLLEYLDPYGHFPVIWLGLRDSDLPVVRKRYGLNFTWSDGSDFRFANWEHEQPDVRLYAESVCVVMSVRTSKWETDFCGEGATHPYMCKVPLIGTGSEARVADSAEAPTGHAHNAHDGPDGQATEATPDNSSKSPPNSRKASASPKAVPVDGVKASNARTPPNGLALPKRLSPFVFNVSFNVTLQ